MLGARFIGIRPCRPRCRRACGRSTRSYSSEAVLNGKTHGITIGATRLATVGDSRRSIDTSDAFSAPYPCRTETENAFHNNWRSAKPSNPGPSDESSQFNGRRFRSRRTLAVGVVSLPAAPRTATLVRFDFCSDENSSEIRTTLREDARNYGRTFGALGRVDITSSTAQLGAFLGPDGLRERDCHAVLGWLCRQSWEVHFATWLVDRCATLYCRPASRRVNLEYFNHEVY